MNPGRFSWLFVALCIIAVPLMLMLALRAETNSQDVSNWLPSSTQQRQVYDDFARMFGVDEAVLISWQDCTNDDPRLSQLKEKLGDPERNHGLIASVTTGAEVLEQLKTDVGLSEKMAKRRLRGVFFGDDGLTTCLVVTMNRQGRQHRKQSMAVIRDAIDQTQQLSVDDVFMGGNTYISCEVDRESTRSMILALPGGILAFAATWFFLGSFRLSIIAMFVAGMSALFSVAIVELTGAKVNGLLVLMPILVLVLTLSGTIHLINYYKAAIREGNVADAINTAMKHGRRPCVLAIVTTSIGIGSLCVSQIQAVRMFGLYSALGLLFALDLLLLLLPSLLHIWRPSENEVRRIRQRRLSQTTGLFTNRFSRRLVRNAIPVSIVCLLMLIPSIIGLGRLETILDVERMFSPTSQVRQNYDWLENNVASLEAVEVLVAYDKPGDVSMLDQVKGVRNIQAVLAKNENIQSTYSVVNFIKSIPTRQRVWDHLEAEAIDEHLIQNQDQLIESRFLAQDHGSNVWKIRAAVGASDTDYAALMEVVRQTTSTQADELETVPEITVTGIWPLASSGHKLLFADLVRSFGLAFLLITPVMMFVLGGVFRGLIAMVPNILPPIIVFGLMGLLGIAADVGAILTASVGLGIAVDDTLHFLEWYRTTNGKGGKTRATRVAFSRCSSAMTQTTLICCAGLAMFGFSNFLPVQLFAMTIIVLLVAALVSDLILLPALISGPLGVVFNNKNRRRQPVLASPAAQMSIYNELPPGEELVFNLPAGSRRHTS